MHLACWAHARRKFEKALQSDRKRAEHALVEIQKLYMVEREAQDFSPEQRKKRRLKNALSVINELGKWLHAELQHVLPKSPIGAAVEYVIPLWVSLQNYLKDGNLSFDDNLVENSIRPVALGTQKLPLCRFSQGAERSKMFCRFFTCCKLNNINPLMWLNYMLENITVAEPAMIAFVLFLPSPCSAPDQVQRTALNDRVSTAHLIAEGAKGTEEDGEVTRVDYAIIVEVIQASGFFT